MEIGDITPMPILAVPVRSNDARIEHYYIEASPGIIFIIYIHITHYLCKAYMYMPVNGTVYLAI